MGSFQAYISQNQLRGYSESQIGWIFSVYAFLAFASGVLVGPLFDKYGPGWLLLVGSVGVVGTMFAMAECSGELGRNFFLFNFLFWGRREVGAEKAV